MSPPGNNPMRCGEVLPDHIEVKVMDIQEVCAVLNIDKLLTELDFLPMSDHKFEVKTCDSKVENFAPRSSVWLSAPILATR